MNPLYLKYAREFALVLLFFLLFSVFKFNATIFNIDQTLAGPGDGIGSLAWFEVYRDRLFDKPVQYFFDGFLNNDAVGMGLMADSVSSGIFWKTVLVPLLIPDLPTHKIYDFFAITIYLFSGLASYYLARTFHVRPFLAIVFGIFILSSLNVAFRLEGHTTLMTPFGFLIQLAFFFLAAKYNVLPYYLAAAFTTWLSFQCVEYYGFYGSIFSAITFLILFIFYHSHQLKQTPFILVTSKNIFFSTLLLILLMAISYPTLIAGKLGLSQNAGEAFQAYSYSLIHLDYYSVREPLRFFYPQNSFYRGSTNAVEFSFRVGPAITLFSLFLFGLIAFLAFKRRLPQARETVCIVIALLFASFILGLVGLHPSKPLSLSEPFFNLAPMFRVTARSYMMSSVGVILSFLLMLSYLLSVAQQSSSFRFRNISYLTLSLALVITLLDATHKLHKPFPTYTTPQKPEIFSHLRENPGAVIELPYFSPTDTPENSYIYTYHWSQHKQTTLNAPFHKIRNNEPGRAEQLAMFSQEANRLDEQFIDRLAAHGVRYIIANCSYNHSGLSAYSNLKQLASNGCTLLYEITTPVKPAEIAPLIQLLDYYPVEIRIPDPSMKFSAQDCKNSSLQLAGNILRQDNNLLIPLTVSNNGEKPWGHQGVDLKLGAVWMSPGRASTEHTPNYGEQRFEIPKSLPSGESFSFDIAVNFPDTNEEYELWLSFLQPKVMWCFHYGIDPLMIDMNNYLDQ